MTDDFHPDQFRDDYQEQLHELVQAKLEGGEAFTVEEQPTELDEDTDDVSDLLAKLEASVKARKSGSSNIRRQAREEGTRQEGRGQEDSGEEDPAKKAPAKKAAAKK